MTAFLNVLGVFCYLFGGLLQCAGAACWRKADRREGKKEWRHPTPLGVDRQ